MCKAWHGSKRASRIAALSMVERAGRPEMGGRWKADMAKVTDIVMKQDDIFYRQICLWGGLLISTYSYSSELIVKDLANRRWPFIFSLVLSAIIFGRVVRIYVD